MLEAAVVQIEATGTFEVPGEGAFEAAGSGSGFIVDPSGLALTNNHVVTGAGTLKVWLSGEEYNATILGVSECLDLAVVDLQGEGFPFLEWREGEINNALEVWAAGFPLGDPEFTITRASRTATASTRECSRCGATAAEWARRSWAWARPRSTAATSCGSSSRFCRRTSTRSRPS